MLKSLIITSTIISVIIFFGLVFGLNYDEIQNTYLSTTFCDTLNSTITKTYSCTTNCDGSCITSSASLCDNSKRDYESIMITDPDDFSKNPIITAECNNGPKCCKTCCSTCTRISTVNGHTSVSTYSCNCHCCNKIDTSKCYTNCRNVFIVTLFTNKDINYKQTFDSVDTASSFVKGHQMEWKCYVNIDKQTIYLSNQMTEWKVVVLSLSVVSCLVCFILLIVDCFYPDLCCEHEECYDNCNC